MPDKVMNSTKVPPDARLAFRTAARMMRDHIVLGGFTGKLAYEFNWMADIFDGCASGEADGFIAELERVERKI